MAKLKTENLLNQISELPIDEQIELYNKIKGLVSENISLHQQKLENEATKYQYTLDKINGN